VNFVYGKWIQLTLIRRPRARTIGFEERTAATMPPPTHPSRHWWSAWRRPKPQASASPDALVATWKTAWLEGANAAWAPDRAYTNPYTQSVERSAWDAGWRWALRNPDRRDQHNERLAHPHRRATDTALKRVAAVGATGVTIYAITRLIRRWSKGSARES
jgi:hypothetical protein